MGAKKQTRSNRHRLQVAAEAARIIATEGQPNYLLAKQKAAGRLGASTRKGLPSNSEVEQELKAWQQMYGGNAHEDQVRQLRAAAAAAMRFLKPFRPRLVGPVLEGTADRHSRISLHVFSEDPDAVMRFLMEHRVPFSQERRRVRWHDGDYRHLDVLVVADGNDTVEMVLMVGRDAVQPPPCPIDGRPQRRMALDEVEALLSPASS